MGSNPDGRLPFKIFSTLCWENFVEKIGENKIGGLGGLMSRKR